MSHLLNTPLSAVEADRLACDHAFRRVFRDDAIFAEFDTERARQAASLQVSKMRMDRFQKYVQNNSKMCTDESA